MSPADDDTDTDELESTPTPRRTVPLGAFVLAVIVAGVLGVLAVVALTVDSGDGRSGDARAVAGRYAERFLSLSHTDFDAWLEDMRSIGTAGFDESVGRREAELRTLLEEAEVTWRGDAVDVFVADQGDGVASALVQYDLHVTDAQGPRTIPDQYLRVDLVESSDGWLVERIISITGDAAPIGGVAPSPPSTASGDSTAPDSGG